MRTPRLGRDRSGEPRWRITGELPFPLLGQTLHKTGAVSGWTSGPVVATCVDVRVDGTDIVLLCQDVVIAGVRGGDSGAPVFQRLSSTSSDIRIAGVLWGGGVLETGETVFVLSAMDNIEMELGPLTTQAPTTTSAPLIATH